LLVLAREESDAALPDERVFLDELAVAAGERQQGTEVAAPEPAVVRGDRAALQRAVDNLLQNSLRYGPAEGRITIAVESGDGLARVTVTDEGPGLQPYEADRAFGRFWRGHHGKSGSGLGLAIVRATAERHGGRAYAEGARFTIELPALRDLSEFDCTTGEETPEKGSP
jgi:signal transduction histidine kinase